MELLGAIIAWMIYLMILISFCAFVSSFVSSRVRTTLKSFGNDISRRSHAFISGALIKTYNASVIEKKREMFEKVAHHINSNDVRILEIGVGSGANLEFYPKDVKIQFVAVDPNQYTEKYLKKRLESYKNIQLEMFSTNYAESMKDVPSNSVDCLISTIVLCSVDDQEMVLAEVKRVLKPGCPFFFMEHVRATPGSYLDKAQKLFNGLWSTCFDGCNVIRDTLPVIQNSGFQEVYYEAFNARLDYLVCLLRPHIFGYATK